jgi:hypothetical protein
VLTFVSASKWTTKKSALKKTAQLALFTKYYYGDGDKDHKFDWLYRTEGGYGKRVQKVCRNLQGKMFEDLNIRDDVNLC